MSFFKGKNWKRKRKRLKFSACGGLKEYMMLKFIDFQYARQKMPPVRAAKICEAKYVCMSKPNKKTLQKNKHLWSPLALRLISDFSFVRGFYQFGTIRIDF